MRIPSDPGRPWRRTVFPALALATALLLPALAVPPAEAQLRPHPAAVSPERAQLRQSIERLYEVLPMRGGLLLKPRASRNGVRSVELTGDTIAVNGETVTPSVLRAWLGEDAPQVLALADLDPVARRQLFGLSTTDVPPAPAAQGSAGLPAPPAPPSPPSASAPEGSEPPEATEAPEAPEPPEPPAHRTSVSSSSHVNVGGSVTVEPGEVAEDAVAIGGSVHVKGEVTGDVSAVGGGAWIDGKVGGGVSAVMGSVHLGPNAEVGGDITSVMGHIDAAPTAKVHGSKTEISPGEILVGGRHHRHSHDFYFLPFFGAAGLVWTGFHLLLDVLLVGFTLLVARPTVERLERRLAAQPWESAGVGLLTGIAFLPAVGILTILTCCLLVIFYPVLIIAVLVVGVLGYTVVAYRLGRWSAERFGARLGDSPYLAALVGVALIEALTVLGRLLAVSDAPFFVSGAVISVGRLVWFATMAFGIGVVLLDRFSTGWRRIPPPPPIPPIPPPPEPPVEPVP